MAVLSGDAQQPSVQPSRSRRRGQRQIYSAISVFTHVARFATVPFDVGDHQLRSGWSSDSALDSLLIGELLTGRHQRGESHHHVLDLENIMG